jgi:hypothetical protein
MRVLISWIGLRLPYRTKFRVFSGEACIIGFTGREFYMGFFAQPPKKVYSTGAAARLVPYRYFVR